MNRAYYARKADEFIYTDNSKILGELVKNHTFSLNDLQKNAWIKQISILKILLAKHSEIYLCLEYSIPRMGKRVDAILIIKNVIVVLEFKIGSDSFFNADIDQTLDYALDLKNFHEESHNKILLPVLVSTEADELSNEIARYNDNVYKPIRLNKNNIENIFTFVNMVQTSTHEIDPKVWINSSYKPTPTIIQAAQALYTGHGVSEISRSDARTYNLNETTNEILKVMEYSKINNEKSICFITGVPGAGKTLAGLNIANSTQDIDTFNENAVFLSGNGPLVFVLQEALARDDVKINKNAGVVIRKTDALNKAKAFIQNIHHFRDEYIQDYGAPVEKVVIFDEAQRAWTKEQTSSFMKRKKGLENFNMSEPEFLIGVMDRHQDWAVIICLIGGGQEINKGEAGLPEWFNTLKHKYKNWNIWVSSDLHEHEYSRGKNLFERIDNKRLEIKEKLHLSVSVRSFRSEKVSSFVKALLDHDGKAKELFSQLKDKYPILITRNIKKAKNWLRQKARGTERTGILASSGGARLKPYGVYVKNNIDPRHWFLNDKNDIRSSFYLEDVATEFDIQGLELDWTCLCWDLDLRINNHSWDYKEFKGTDWNNINDESKKLYLKNSYRVLLTRARQGMVIFVPEGNKDDHTRMPGSYNLIYEYLKKIGIEELT